MSSETPTPPDPLARWQTLHERENGIVPEPELFEDVEPHMLYGLRQWCDKLAFSQSNDLARSVLARFRVHWHSPADREPRDVLKSLILGKATGVTTPGHEKPLDYLNAFIHLHPHWDGPFSIPQQEQWQARLDELDNVLRECSSAWYVDRKLRGLYRRVDGTVTAAWRDARQAADDTGQPAASRHLAQAWQRVFGMRPQPTDGYGDAVKAVEAVACPVVLPDKTEQGKATVHQARNELTRNADRWRFVLVEDDQVQAGHGSVDVVATMLNRLLRGETERHALEGRNRPSTQGEAEAAIHLAAILVQWFARSHIQPR